MYEFIGKHTIGCLMTYIHTVHVVTKGQNMLHEILLFFLPAIMVEIYL